MAKKAARKAKASESVSEPTADAVTDTATAAAAAPPAERVTERPPGPLTDEEKERMQKISDYWVSVTYKTGRTDQEELQKAIGALYAMVDHKQPPTYVCESPYTLAVSSVICTRYWREVEVGNHLKAYNDVLAALDELGSEPQRPHIERAVRAVLPLPTTEEAVKALKNGTRTASTTTISLGDYLAGGNFWPALPAFYDACYEVLGLRLDCFNYFPFWRRAAELSGYRWVHQEFCIVCDFPDVLQVNEEYQPHNESGPSHAWSDGWALWHINGHKMSEKIVMRPHEITVDEIHAEQNNDIRSIMLDRKGWPNYIREAKLEPVDTYVNEVENDSREALFKTPFGQKVLLVTCPTGRMFALPVVDSRNTCKEAREWIHGDKPLNIIGRT